MKQFTCIVCPKGCTLTIEKKQDEWIVSDNSCPRGEVYAKEEMIAPKRILTSTIRVKNGVHPVCPIISTSPIPKEKLTQCMKEIWKVEIEAPIYCGDIVIKNIASTGIDMVASRDFEEK